METRDKRKAQMQKESVLIFQFETKRWGAQEEKQRRKYEQNIFEIDF